MFHQKRKEINTNRYWLPFSELLDLLSRKPIQRLFRLFFCLFLFKQLVCVSLENKRNQYEQVLASFFLNCWTSYQENPCNACSNSSSVFFYSNTRYFFRSKKINQEAWSSPVYILEGNFRYYSFDQKRPFYEYVYLHIL